LVHNPLKVIEYSDRWDDLLKVCQYFQQNPKPNLYIRELPIQVHTKFIEQNQKIIRSLLEVIIPVEYLVSIEGENNFTFEKRFSLKYSEPLIRLRLLDESLKVKYGFPVADISIPLSEFRQLNLDIHHCFITENLMNFLTLPPLENSLAIFGSGYAIQTLKTARWLSHCPIFYWGDLDVDGFKILSQLRSYFPQAISIMMDMITFETFHEFAVSVVVANAENLPHLTSEEKILYTHLALHQKRLEQERISQDYANQFLRNLMQQR
ncbi:MAG: Wadjet anti-phage system protein JetD domain-containing protein, partial [Phormidium sp.]